MVSGSDRCLELDRPPMLTPWHPYSPLMNSNTSLDASAAKSHLTTPATLASGSEIMTQTQNSAPVSEVEARKNVHDSSSCRNVTTQHVAHQGAAHKAVVAMRCTDGCDAYSYAHHDLERADATPHCMRTAGSTIEITSTAGGMLRTAS